MYLGRKTLENYVAPLAAQYGLSHAQVEAILQMGLRNLCKAFLHRQEVSIRGLFSIYVHKKARAREIKCQRKATESKSETATSS
jgi:nucleoid DNA-binding protein